MTFQKKRFKIAPVASISRHALSILLILILVSCGGGGETVRVESSQPHLTKDKDELNRLLGLNQHRDTTLFVPKKTMKRNDSDGQTVSDRDSLQQVIDGLRDDLASVKRRLEVQAILIDSLMGELAAGTARGSKAVSFKEVTKNDAEIAKPKKTPLNAAVTKDKVDPVKAQYDDALAAMRKKKYKTASSTFEKIMAEHPDHDLAAASQIQLAECYFLMGDFAQALVDFQKALTFPGSAGDAIQLKIGMCYVKMQNTSRAREAFEKIISQFPKSPYAKTAKDYLAQL